MLEAKVLFIKVHQAYDAVYILSCPETHEFLCKQLCFRTQTCQLIGVTWILWKEDTAAFNRKINCNSKHLMSPHYYSYKYCD